MPRSARFSTGNPCSQDRLSPTCQLLFSGFESVIREILFISHAGAVRRQLRASRTICYFPVPFVLHLPFCVHLPSCNLPPQSCSIYPASCILHPPSILCLVFSIMDPVSFILHAASCFLHLPSPFSFLCPAAKVPGGHFEAGASSLSHAVGLALSQCTPLPS